MFRKIRVEEAENLSRFVLRKKRSAQIAPPARALSESLPESGPLRAVHVSPKVAGESVD